MSRLAVGVPQAWVSSGKADTDRSADYKEYSEIYPRIVLVRSNGKGAEYCETRVRRVHILPLRFQPPASPDIGLENE
jgi:hypothetical protein